MTHRTVLSACAAMLLLATVAMAADSPGLQVGQKAPAFTLTDQNGKKVTSQSLLQKGPVALVFYRSADW